MSNTEVLPDLSNESRKPLSEPVRLPAPLRTETDSPAQYNPDPGLVDAFKVMLLLRRPLLLTGEPGTGKTQAANYLSWKLGLSDQAIRFDAKTTSSARDLFYSYNTIGRFHAAQTNVGSQQNVDYMQYSALGTAILRAMPIEALKGALPESFVHPGAPTQSVVLIDEIDKAPRDFPNDLLNELENMIFRVPELNNRIFTAEKNYFPFVILTSNSEKNLPAAFLRRCIFFHIPKPDKNKFAAILGSRLKVDLQKPLIQDTLDFIMYARSNEAELSKVPATAEMLDFVLVLRSLGARLDQRLKDVKPLVEASLTTLIKSESDSRLGLLNDWLSAS